MPAALLPAGLLQDLSKFYTASKGFSEGNLSDQSGKLQL